MESTSKINKYITIFFIVIFLLYGFYQLGMGTFVGLAWGNGVGFLGVPLALLFYFLSFKTYSSLTRRNIHQGIIFLALLIVNAVLFFVSILLLSLDGGLFFSIPTSFSIISIYFIWIVYKFFHEKLTQSRIGSITIVATGLLLSGLLINGLAVTNIITDKMEDRVQKKSLETRHEELKQNISIHNIKDKLIYTTKGNPVGISLSFTINSRQGFPTYTESFETSTLFPSNPNSIKNHNSGTFFISLKPEYVNINPPPDIFSKEEGTFDVVAHTLPSYLRANVGSSGIVDLQTACTMNLPQQTAELEFTGTYEYDPIDSRSSTGGDFSIVTKNAYSPKAFYETIQKEKVEHCPGYEPIKK